MLHQGLKVKKKLNNFSNFKSVVSELCRISLQVIKRHPNASKLGTFNWDGGYQQKSVKSSIIFVHFQLYLTYPVMKKLSKANWLFLFHPIDNQSENHWRKLAHCTLRRHKNDNPRITDLSKMLMWAFLKSAIYCYWSAISIKGPPTDT